MIGSLLASWDPYPSKDQGGDRASAKAEMSGSRYARQGICSDPVCRDVPVVIARDVMNDQNVATLRSGLQALGIEPNFIDQERFDCYSQPSVAEKRRAMCVGGWIPDYPDAGNMFVPFLAAPNGGPALLGATSGQLRSWRYAIRRVPSIDADYARCAAEQGLAASMC